MPELIGLTNFSYQQRRHVDDAGSPHFLQSVTVHSAPSNARLRKLTVHYSSFSTPRGQGHITAKSNVVTDFLMSEYMSKRRDRVQLRQFLYHLTMRDDDVCTITS